MRTSGTHNKPYTQQPGWSVEHRPVSDVLSPTLLRARIGKRLFLATSAVAGLTLIAASFGVVAHMQAPGSTPDQTEQSSTVQQHDLPQPAAATPEQIHDTTTKISPGTTKNEHSTQVTINGTSIPVPENGRLHKTLTTDTQSTIDITVQNESTSSN